jgi:hypothetical protein
LQGQNGPPFSEPLTCRRACRLPSLANPIILSTYLRMAFARVCRAQGAQDVCEKVVPPANTTSEQRRINCRTLPAHIAIPASQQRGSSAPQLPTFVVVILPWRSTSVTRPLMRALRWSAGLPSLAFFTPCRMANTVLPFWGASMLSFSSAGNAKGMQVRHEMRCWGSIILREPLPSLYLLFAAEECLQAASR